MVAVFKSLLPTLEAGRYSVKKNLDVKGPRFVIPAVLLKINVTLSK